MISELFFFYVTAVWLGETCIKSSNLPQLYYLNEGEEHFYIQFKEKTKNITLYTLYDQKNKLKESKMEGDVSLNLPKLTYRSASEQAP